jgi:mRNA interferase YafQ
MTALMKCLKTWLLKVRFATKFKKDIKILKKQGLNIDELKAVMELIQEEKEIPGKYRDHFLTGNWNEFRECHIRADWLLIYRIQDDCVIFARTGSHSEIL